MSEYWIKQRPQYYVQTGSMLENPYGVPRAEVAKYIANNTSETVAQVVFGKYVDASGLVFSSEIITQLFDRSMPKVTDDFWIDEPRWKQGRVEQAEDFNPSRYATGVDLARKKDYTVIFTIDTEGASVSNPGRIVYYRRLNRVPWDVIYAEIGRAHLHLFPGPCLADSTGLAGDVILDALSSRYYCPIHHAAFEKTHTRCPEQGRDDKACDPDRHWRPFDVDGFVFAPKTKVSLVNHLQNVLGIGYVEDDEDRPYGLLRCPPIETLQDELAEYAWKDEKLMTDTVFGLALAAWQGLDAPVQPILQESIYGV